MEESLPAPASTSNTRTIKAQTIISIIIIIRVSSIMITIMNNAKQSTVAYEKELPQQIQQIITITTKVIETVPEDIIIIIIIIRSTTII